MNDLPNFAQQWIQQWKSAAPRLQEIRDEELRRLDSKSHRQAGGVVVFDRYPERNGMVVMRQWFQRRQLLELSKKLTNQREG